MFWGPISTSFQHLDVFNTNYTRTMELTGQCLRHPWQLSWYLHDHKKGKTLNCLYSRSWVNCCDYKFLTRLRLHGERNTGWKSIKRFSWFWIICLYKFGIQVILFILDCEISWHSFLLELWHLVSLLSISESGSLFSFSSSYL